MGTGAPGTQHIVEDLSREASLYDRGHRGRSGLDKGLVYL